MGWRRRLGRCRRGVGLLDHRALQRHLGLAGAADRDVVVRLQRRAGRRSRAPTSPAACGSSPSSPRSPAPPVEPSTMQPAWAARRASRGSIAHRALVRVPGQHQRAHAGQRAPPTRVVHQRDVDRLARLPDRCRPAARRPRTPARSTCRDSAGPGRRGLLVRGEARVADAGDASGRRPRRPCCRARPRWAGAATAACGDGRVVVAADVDVRHAELRRSTTTYVVSGVAAPVDDVAGVDHRVDVELLARRVRIIGHAAGLRCRSETCRMRALSSAGS